MSFTPKTSTSSFRKRIAAGFVATLLAGLFICLSAVYALHTLGRAQERVVFGDARDLVNAEKLRSSAEQSNTASRGFLFTGNQEFLLRMHAERKLFKIYLFALRNNVSGPIDLAMVDRIAQAESDHEKAEDALFTGGTRPRGSVRDLDHLFEKTIAPKRSKLEAAVNALVNYNERTFAQGRQRIRTATRRAMLFIGIIAFAAFALAGILAFILTQTLAKLYAQAMRATQMRDDLLAVVSHDLKNPITSVQMNAELLSKVSVNDERLGFLHERLRQIKSSSVRMNAIIGGLLDLARLDAGRLPFEMGSNVAGQMIDVALDVLRPMAEAKNQRFEVSGDLSLHVYCDKERIIRVISNLVSNAIKFSPENGVIGIQVVESSAAKAGHSQREKMVKFSVSDRGPGIPADRMSHLFDRYWQAPETARLGTGLGLSIVKGFVEAQGGALGVISRVGQGTTFYFTLLEDTKPQSQGGAAA